jgi:fermentation-respiration switch protein FrsA (DUF1100 family)
MVGCDGLFYYPNAVNYGSPTQFRLAHESVDIRAGDGSRLHGWFFPARQRPAGTVLHLHGNAGNISGHFQHVAWLPAAGWNVLCFDYRGYGQSEGKVSRAGTIADAHAALDHLLSRSDVDADRIVAFGQSLGGAIGIVLTAERPQIRGLAVDGAFDSYRGIAAWHVRRSPLLFCVGWWVPGMLMSKGYDPIDYVDRIAPRPLFIMHGTDDRVVDPAMGRRLFEAAREPKELWMPDGADHYSAMLERADESHPRLLAFFRRCVNSEG